MAAVGLVVGRFSFRCGNVLKLFTGPEKEKNGGVGKKVGREARMEAAEAALLLLWSKNACNSVEISPLYIFISCLHLISYKLPKQPIV